MSKYQILKGHIVFTDTPNSFNVIENGYIVSSNGSIVDTYQELPQQYESYEVKDYGDALIIPGFYDLHNHAGQYLQRGTGMGKQLLDWLTDYTYKLERDLADVEFAEVVYKKYVNHMLKNGTLGACSYATSSTEGTECLFEAFKGSGMRAYVGKVNMERNAPGYIIESVEKSLEGTKYLIEKYKHEQKVKPIITPRFAPTSKRESMIELGKMASTYNVPIQTHISENMDEIAWVKELYPECKDYASVYKDYNLWGQTPTLMAHAVHLNDSEINMCKEENLYIVHCPDSNINVRSGIAPIKKYLDNKINVGIGTDIAGGHKIQMTEAIVRTIQSSKILSVQDPSALVSFPEAFYMATAKGGAFFGNVGKLKPGYKLDAIVIEDDELYKNRYSILDRLEKFIYTGDDRWILDRYVSGKKLDIR